MTDREKLVELIDEVAEGTIFVSAGEQRVSINSDDIADRLIANGVTVREWRDAKTDPVDKVILDATCGTRSIWFDKHCPAAIYFDQRQGCVAKKMGTKRYERTMFVEPDVVGSFRQLPFPDESFYHVVFDPPHLHVSEKAWIYNMYGSLPKDWQSLIRDGFQECMRVLKPYGTLVFKWSDLEITTREVINVIGCEPLYGHRSGKKMNTHWMVFVKGVSGVGGAIEVVH